MDINNLQKKAEQAGDIIDKNGIDLIVSWVKGDMINYSQSGYGSQHFHNGRQVINKYINHLEGTGEKGCLEISKFCDKVINGDDNITVPFIICI